MTQTPEPQVPAPPPRFATVQRRIAAAFDLTEASQRIGIEEMLLRSARAAPAYWLQIVLAMGIATLGLVLGSTAVVIGAMLVSPLMAPLVELGMGLAVGSPLLVVRSSVRVAVSVALVVGLSALVVFALPFHEITSEIAARTTPNALDLLIAVCCAIAAAYTTTQRGSDTAATAAGTSIGIALVPPLCVIGYGIGTGSAAVAGGAALLFTANFCAIILFAVVAFLLLGYNRVDVVALEAAELGRGAGGSLQWLARGLHRLFHARYGTLFRVLMPLALVGAIIVPLRSALLEVAWQVRVRAAVEQLLSAQRATVRSSVSLEQHAVKLRLVVVGSPGDAAALEADLSRRIGEVAGVKPRVDVLAVPDIETMKAVAATAAAPAAPVAPKRDLGDARELATAAVARRWPTGAGSLVRWSLDFRPEAESVVHVVHTGAALGAAGEQLLSAALAQDLGISLRIDDRAFPAEPMSAEVGDIEPWLARALVLLGRTSDEPLLHACVETPDPKAAPARDRREI